jgi:hypothetical protein
LGIGGIVQGGGLLSDKVSFEEIAGLTHPWLLAAMFAQAVLLFGNVLLTFNFVFTLALSRTAATAQFRPAVAMEASAS